MIVAATRSKKWPKVPRKETDDPTTYGESLSTPNLHFAILIACLTDNKEAFTYKLLSQLKETKA
jgi:hypothetical protein